MKELVDDIRIPYLLVENKAELVEFEDDPSLQEFAEINGFCGCFRTSSKTGYNVDESMKYLIRIIIKRMEEMQLEKIDDWTNDGRIALDPKIYKTTSKKNACNAY